MVPFFRHSFFLLLILSTQFVFSQVKDSLADVPKQEVTFTIGLENDDDFVPNNKKTRVDTTLSSLHYFDLTDRAEFRFRNTGNSGSAHFPVAYQKQETVFQTGYGQYSLYRLTKENIRFYRHVKPYSHLRMMFGQRKEQMFEVTHSQNIKKKFNFGFHYLRMAGEGAYLRQKTRHNDIALTTRFNSDGYELKTLLLFNNIRADENGGIINTGIFEDTSFVSKQLVAVQLDEAENKRQDIKFHLLHHYENAGCGKVLTRKWRLYHELDLSREKYEYSDLQPDSAYYGLFNDTLDEYASGLRHWGAGNTIGFKKFFGKNFSPNRQFELDIFYAHTFNVIRQDGFAEKKLQDAKAGIAFLKNAQGGGISYGISATYSFLDYNKDDFNSTAFIAYDFDRAGEIQAEVTHARTQPQWLFHRFSFGAISWENDFDKSAELSSSLSYRLPEHEFYVSAQFHQIDGFTFWAENRLPAQTHALQQVWVLEARKLFRLRYFGFDNLIRMQFASDKKFLRLPLYSGVHSLFYERGVFKGKLLTRVGVDIRYNTNYKAYGYFPLTGQFHLQEEQTLKFYPVMDFYISFKVQTVRLFLIMNHINQGMFGDKGYFNAYKYPADDRRFRFGVSWMFLD